MFEILDKIKKESGDTELIGQKRGDIADSIASSVMIYLSHELSKEFKALDSSRLATIEHNIASIARNYTGDK